MTRWPLCRLGGRGSETLQGETADHLEAHPTEDLLDHRRLWPRDAQVKTGWTGAQFALADHGEGAGPFAGDFCRRPLDPFPTAVLELIVLNRAALRAMATEPVVAQQAADVAKITLAPGQYDVDGCHAEMRPQLGPVSTAHWAFDEGLHAQLDFWSAVRLDLRHAFHLLAKPALPTFSNVYFQRQDTRPRTPRLRPTSGAEVRFCDITAALIHCVSILHDLA